MVIILKFLSTEKNYITVITYIPIIPGEDQV